MNLTTEIKTRPILFSAQMIRALLAGEKTMTRRILKPQPFGAVNADPNSPSGLSDQRRKPVKMRYGLPGDKLWVREKWQPIWATDQRPPHGLKSSEGWKIGYPATDGIQEWHDEDECITDRCNPSIHMPRWASRITLEIEEVRIERVQMISEEDAMAEGMPTALNIPGNPDNITSRDRFKALWVQLNGALSWAANPWVYCIKFQRVK